MKSNDEKSAPRMKKHIIVLIVILLTDFWSGYRDEVVLYDSVLTQQQIKDLFDFATICIPEPGTVVLLGAGHPFCDYS